MRTLTGAAVRLPTRQFDGPQPATVRRVTGGQLFVALTGAPTLEIGPVRWAKPTAAIADPAAGTGVLVLFAGTGIADPWAVAWDRWPA